MFLANRYRGTILTMLFLAMVINYIDRAALAIAMPFITKDFHLSVAEKGVIFSSFSIGYAIFNFVGGYLADRFGGKRVFTWTMTIWSVLCGLTAGVFSFTALLAVRVLFGAGEGPISTTANKVVNNWFPVKERARAIGINQAGGPLGGALAGPVVGLLALWLGWRVAFVVIAALGLMWAFCWRKLATEYPAQHPRVTPAELELIGQYCDEESGEASSARPRLTHVIFQRAVLVTGISLFCYNYILFFFMSWFPSYLIDAKGISLKNMSFVAALPWLIGALGYMSGGALIDAIYKRTGKLLLSRKCVLVTCLLVASLCIGLTGLVDDVRVAVGVMTVAIGFLMLTAPAYWSIIQDSVPRNQVGTAGGFMHGLANVSGIVGPALTGLLIQRSGSYATGFVLAGTLGIAGALIVALFLKPPRPSLIAQYPATV